MHLYCTKQNRLVIETKTKPNRYGSVQLFGYKFLNKICLKVTILIVLISIISLKGIRYLIGIKFIVYI